MKSTSINSLSRKPGVASAASTMMIAARSPQMVQQAHRLHAEIDDVDARSRPCLQGLGDQWAERIVAGLNVTAGGHEDWLDLDGSRTGATSSEVLC